MHAQQSFSVPGASTLSSALIAGVLALIDGVRSGLFGSDLVGTRKGHWRRRGAEDHGRSVRRAEEAMTELPKNWDQMSVGALWEQLNDPKQWEISKSTVDAFDYLVRLGDGERLKSWLATRSPAERRGRLKKRLVLR